MFKKAFVATVMLFAAAVFSTPVHAAPRAGCITVSPFVGGYLWEGNEGIEEHDFNAGAGLGYMFTDKLGVEGVFQYIPGQSENAGGDTHGYIYKLDGLYHFPITKTIVPYVAAGLGGITINPDRGESHSHFLVNYGGGLKYYLTDDLALRADVRHIVSFNDTYNNMSYTFGIVYQFGGRKKPAPAPKPVVKPAPAPAPKPVVKPAPAPKPAVKPAPAPAPKPVVKPAPAPQIKKEVTLRIKIEFDTDKSFVRPRYHNELKKVADYLKQYPDNQAVIEGFTDNRGSAVHNMKLSQRRADAVRKYLVEKFGVNSEKLSAKGYGKENPIASNKTKAGRQKNRRVELHIKPLK